jgi:hypothetical protein
MDVVFVPASALDVTCHVRGLAACRGETIVEILEN